MTGVTCLSWVAVARPLQVTTTSTILRRFLHRITYLIHCRRIRHTTISISRLQQRTFRSISFGHRILMTVKLSSCHSTVFHMCHQLLLLLEARDREMYALLRSKCLRTNQEVAVRSYSVKLIILTTTVQIESQELQVVKDSLSGRLDIRSRETCLFTGSKVTEQICNQGKWLPISHQMHLKLMEEPLVTWRLRATPIWWASSCLEWNLGPCMEVVAIIIQVIELSFIIESCLITQMILQNWGLNQRWTLVIDRARFWVVVE